MLGRLKNALIALVLLAGVLTPMIGPSACIPCAHAVSETVMFNTNTYKYHSPSCRWAQRCTVHCISITKSEAIKRGGVPCKVCGG